MVDNLYSAGASLLQGSAGTASDIVKADQAKTDTTVQAGTSAQAQLGETQRQKMQAQAAIKQIDEQGLMQGHMMKITPQVALGLVKESNDPEWMKLIGQVVPTGYVLGQQKLAFMKKFSTKTFKAPDGEDDVVYGFKFNPDTGSMEPYEISRGKRGTPKSRGDVTPEDKYKTTHPKAGTTSKEDPKDKEFLKTYRQYQKDTEGMNGLLLQQLAKKDPKQAKVLRDKLDFVQKNANRFNELQNVKSDVPRGTTRGDDQKAIDYLKKNYPQLTNPTPQDIEWAKGKLGG